MKNDHTFFANRDCRYYPCHEGADPECFNCLFCFCPLYALGAECGGKFRYTPDGVKDCSDCMIPHGKNSHSYICSRIAACGKSSKKA